MSTSHRGLPLPPAMTLPAPSSTQNLSQLPDRWQHGNDETQRTWLQAKSEEERRRQEEERRRQEEERTKQENFRLEIRRTELEMLREAFRGGVPPQLVPVIFTGGGALAGTSAEWANHYITQLNQNQQQLLQGNIVSPPDSRMETRLLTASEHHTPQSGTMSTISRTPAQAQTPATSHMHSGSAHNAPTSYPAPSNYSPFSMPGLSPAARSQTQQIHTSEPPRSSLPRINTNELHVQPPPQGPPPGLNMQLSGVPSHSQANTQHLTPHHTPQSHHQTPQQPPPPPPPPEPSRQSESSPIFFHHWQPPSTQSTASNPMASTSPPSAKNNEPSFPHQPYASGNEVSHSPKKRKIASSVQNIAHTTTTGPVSSVQTNTFSPSFSPGSSTGASKRRGVNTTHNRNRSDSGSTRGYEPYAKSAAARPRRPETGSNFNDGNGATSQFHIGHMMAHEESLDGGHREPQSNSTHNSPIPHQHFQAGPESRRDHHIHREREDSISHGPPSLPLPPPPPPSRT